MRLLASCFLLSALCATSFVVAAENPRVTLELLARPGMSLTTQQQWYKVLSEQGISGLRIHAPAAGEEMGVSERGTSKSREYHVVGVLAADNMLYLPGGKFALSDVGKLRKWLDNLSDAGADGVTAPRSAFGFTARQLEQVNDDLTKPVSFPTKDMPAATAVSRIARGLKYPIEIDELSRRGLANVTVGDELQGVSSGTALAAIVRPAGLVLVPERPRGDEFRYRLTRAQAGREAWPVGWKPKHEKIKVLPDLFDSLNVEMSEVPVSEAVDAIGGRLKVPLLYDYNAMAQFDVDPAKTEATVPAKKMTYSQALGRVLSQAKLQYELRVDEADKPLLWITTLRQAK